MSNCKNCGHKCHCDGKCKIEITNEFGEKYNIECCGNCRCENEKKIKNKTIKGKIRTIDNFLENNTFLNIKQLLLSADFPYFYNSTVASKEDISDFYFNHVFYFNNQQHSLLFPNVVLPIIEKYGFKKLLRAKCNLYTKKEKQIPTDFHIDSEKPHTVLLYSVNTNNGYTLFKSGEKIYSKENQLIIFNGLLEHCSVSQTDEKIRVNVNINIEE